jgi:hypothetical protein
VGISAWRIVPHYFSWKRVFVRAEHVRYPLVHAASFSSCLDFSDRSSFNFALGRMATGAVAATEKAGLFPSFAALD